MAENRALGGSRHKLVLVLLAGVFAQIAEAPGVELVEGGLGRHGGEVFGVKGAGLAGRGDGNDGVVGEVVAAGEGDALGGGDETGEHCFCEEIVVSPWTHTHETLSVDGMAYLLLEGVSVGFP